MLFSKKLILNFKSGREGKRNRSEKRERVVCLIYILSFFVGQFFFLYDNFFFLDFTNPVLNRSFYSTFSIRDKPKDIKMHKKYPKYFMSTPLVAQNGNIDVFFIAFLYDAYKGTWS